jgi:predicted dehydrogenase
MTVKLGILGFAHGHVNAYCNQWRQQESLGVELCAGWDHDAERLAQHTRDIELPSYDSPQALLQTPGIDAVIIAAETSMHADLVEQSAAAGKAIILQKPMSLTLEEADRIVAACDSTGVPFTMAWQMRVDPENLKIRDLLAGEEFGRVLSVRRRHGLSVLLDENFHSSWHLDPACNRDIWADDAAHAIDFIYWLLGKPRSVTAELMTRYDSRFENDTGEAIFRYPDGPIAVVSCCFACSAHENSTEVIAENGVIIQNYGDAPSTSIARPSGSASLKWMMHGDPEWTVCDLPPVAGQGERIERLAGPLAEFLHGDRAPIATAKEGREVLRMVLACYEANDAGRRISLDAL